LINSLEILQELYSMGLSTFQILQVQDGGRLPSWKWKKRNISKTVPMDMWDITQMLV